MTMPLIPAACVLAGVLAYALSSNAKVQEIGRITYAMALLVLLLAISSHGTLRF